jgi:leucyl/phenylalanyl-tRNA--protein transferase
MGCGDGRLRWFSPDPRGVLPLDGFRRPRGFRRALPRLAFLVTVNTAFDEVVEGCADRPETWIDPAIAQVYSVLHRQGAAHSVEVWEDGRLAGGLYGVQLGSAFFGESMFSRVSGASKVALAVLVELLRGQDFTLLDIQWVTPHLAGFGAVEVRREAYLRLLRAALRQERSFPGGIEAPLAAAR